MTFYGQKICLDATEVHLRARELILDRFDVSYTQNFEIWSPKGTSHTRFDKECVKRSLVQQISSNNKSDGIFVW
jgi:hypothetical protein